jgi:predicted nucleic acid-binding protein
MSISRRATALRLTTGFVLLEVGNAMSRAVLRSRFVEFYAWLRQHPRARIVPVSEELFHRGCELYAAREDKDWSLTDCLSFIVMRDEELQAALTHDQHFEQAGHQALLC